MGPDAGGGLAEWAPHIYAHMASPAKIPRRSMAPRPLVMESGSGFPSHGQPRRHDPREPDLCPTLSECLSGAGERGPSYEYEYSRRSERYCTVAPVPTLTLAEV